MNGVPERLRVIARRENMFWCLLLLFVFLALLTSHVSGGGGAEREGG